MVSRLSRVLQAFLDPFVKVFWYLIIDFEQQTTDRSNAAVERGNWLSLIKYWTVLSLSFIWVAPDFNNISQTRQTSHLSPLPHHIHATASNIRSLIHSTPCLRHPASLCARKSVIGYGMDWDDVTCSKRVDQWWAPHSLCTKTTAGNGLDHVPTSCTNKCYC